MHDDGRVFRKNRDRIHTARETCEKRGREEGRGGGGKDESIRTDVGKIQTGFSFDVHCMYRGVSIRDRSIRARDISTSPRRIYRDSGA